jgi:translation initiation factor IF-2
MKDNYGDKESASPSTAVQMSGLNAVPIAGDDFSVATSLDEVSFEPRLMSHSVTCVYQDNIDPLIRGWTDQSHLDCIHVVKRPRDDTSMHLVMRL